MLNKSEPKIVLPPIPAKRYFTIGEVSELCGVKPHVLRYWEQEFTQLRPMKRRGNRRYYQHHEVLLVRRIRDLLYEQGFTISGARNRLSEMGGNGRVRVAAPAADEDLFAGDAEGGEGDLPLADESGDSRSGDSQSGESSSMTRQGAASADGARAAGGGVAAADVRAIRDELLAALKLLS
ncbi:MAG: MerR family transcriptional regulator [Burkholderiales bacterium]|nr:MerR family transcriptional regulator [Burkholderiales bacterium]